MNTWDLRPNKNIRFAIKCQEKIRIQGVLEAYHNIIEKYFRKVKKESLELVYCAN